VTAHHRIAALREEIRRIGACDHATLDAVAAMLDDREITVLAGKLGNAAAHIASRTGTRGGLPPPGTVPGAGAERIDLTAQWNAVTVAGWFVHKTLMSWWWTDVLFDGVYVTYELAKAFVGAVQEHEPDSVTRMTLRLRALSTGRLVVELHDSSENAAWIAAADGLISEQVAHLALRSGRYEANGRTVLWCELARPDSSRWI